MPEQLLWIGVGEAPLREHPLDRPDVERLGRVRGRGDGQLARAETKRAVAPVCDEGGELERLCGRAEPDLEGRVPNGGQEPAVLADDGNGAPMQRLDQAAANDLDERDRHPGGIE